MPDTPSLRPSCVLAAFLEQVADGRRVIVFGDATSRFSENLLDRGARLVHVCDPDTSRVATAAARNTSQSVSYAPLAPSGLSVREGAFDLGIVENLSALASLGPELVLRQLSRALAPNGVAVVACPNPEVASRLVGRVQETETVDYYELFDLVNAQFEGVRMFGQMPFLGYSIAAFGAQGEVEPALDSGFLPGGTEEPEWFLALAGSRAEGLERFQIVQLPVETLSRGARAMLHRELQAARASEAAALERLAEEEAECARLREVSAASHERRGARDVEELRRQLAEREAWIAELDGRAATADARADEVEAELEETLTALGRLAAALGKAPGASAADVSEFGDVDDLGRLLVDEIEKAVEATQERVRSLEHSASVAEESRLALDAALEASRKRVTDTEVAALAEKEASLRLAKELEALEAELEVSSGRIRGLEDRLRAADEDPGEDAALELGVLEEQLIERGQHIRGLERDLKESERLAQELLLELDQLRRLQQDTPESAGWSASMASPPTDAWANATQQFAEDATTRVDQQFDRQGDVGADRLRETEVAGPGNREILANPGREAELVAELQMARWAVDKLQAELEAVKVAASREQELERELEQARGELMRQAGLIESLQIVD